VRRLVRTTENFWANLDRALPTDHEPSWHAFAAHDLPDAIERFATVWDVLPPLIPGRPDYRVIIDAGRTVYSYAIEAQLARDGAIELITIAIDLVGPDDPSSDH
jgi:hypothetical protein